MERTSARILHRSKNVGREPTMVSAPSVADPA
jgi:hypothetical protein